VSFVSLQNHAYKVNEKKGDLIKQRETDKTKHRQ